MSEIPLRSTPCKVHCPAEIDIPRCHRLISDAKWDEALSVLREKVPFPAVLGRICVSPCEGHCRKGEIENPVAIRALHRLVAERGATPAPHAVSDATGKRVAVIGSGPCGLTAAYYVALFGHRVVVFEALPEPGGMMRVGIPDYRLPKDILKQEIQLIEELGVEIKTNTRISSLDELLDEQGYDAVIVAIGAHKSQKMGIEGEDTAGVIDVLSFLRDFNLGKESTLGERVVVIGGGNSAIDAARVCLRLGAKEVTILYRRSKEEMPANPAEVEEALKEGVTIEFLAAPTTISRTDGKLQVECVRMCLGKKDTSGRRKPVPVADSDFTMEANTVIAAVGQIPDISNSFGFPTPNGAVLEVNPDTFATTRNGVFAGGDAIGGSAWVIKAIADGRKAAIAVDQYLGGTGDIAIWAPSAEEEVFPDIPVSLSDRAEMPTLDITDRLTGFQEVELALLEGAGIREAKRCSWCDVEPIVMDNLKCSGCMMCQLRCSFVHTGVFNLEDAGIVIIEVPPGCKEITFNENCLGCGVCGRYCSYGAIKFKKKSEANL